LADYPLMLSFAISVLVLDLDKAFLKVHSEKYLTSLKVSITYTGTFSCGLSLAYLIAQLPLHLTEASTFSLHQR